MFYVFDISKSGADRPITLPASASTAAEAHTDSDPIAEFEAGDIDFVDDALLNIAPHNAIEKQLLRGDVVGLALMSSAIIWSAMGAFG